MGALDRITHISAALLLCARGTYAQQATQAGAGLGLRGATVRAGSHSAQTMTSHMFAPRVTRLCSLVRLISQTLPTEHTSRKERALRRYFDDSEGKLGPRILGS